MTRYCNVIIFLSLTTISYVAFFLPTLTVIFALPFFFAVNTPALSTERTFFFDDLKDILRFAAFFGYNLLI
jgi:hypothetical protein